MPANSWPTAPSGIGYFLKESVFDADQFIDAWNASRRRDRHGPSP